MTLKFKVVFIISALLLSVSIISSIINYHTNVEATQSQLKNISLPLSLDNIYTDIQQKMIEPVLISSLMANDTFLKDWISDGEKDVKQIQRYLKEIQDKYNIFTSFVVSDKTKSYYHSRGLIDKVNINNKNDDWYYSFKESKQEYEVNLDINSNFSESLIMFINYQVKDYKNDFLALTGVGVRLFDIESMLGEFKDKYGYDVYFLNSQGEIILHTKSLNKRGNIDFIDGLKNIKNKIYEDKEHSFEYSYKNQNYLLSTKYIPQLKLYLLVEINKESYMHDLKENFYINLLASLLVTLIVTLIILFIINIYQKQLENLANEDALTGIANRRSFNKDMDKIINLYNRANIKTVKLILLDIDNFKTTNDTYGHIVGDKVLIRLANLIKSQFRKTDIVVRWGGEEFAIVLIDTEQEMAVSMIEKLQKLIKNDTELIALNNAPVTISLGLGTLESKDSFDGLILKTDEALYKAKKTGKDKLVVAS